MAYKANSTFSFGGRPYVEGQEFVESDDASTETLLKQGFISKGSGKSREEVEQEASDEQENKGQENAKKHAEAAEAERLRVIEAGKNSVNFRPTIDQTKSTKTVASTEGNEKVETPAKKSAKKAAKK